MSVSINGDVAESGTAGRGPNCEAMKVHEGIDVFEAGKFKMMTGTQAVMNEAHPAVANKRNGHQQQRPKPTGEPQHKIDNQKE